MQMVKTSYSPNDVTVLLKDLTGCMEAMSTEDREKAIQSGVHYSEMLPLEYAPTEDYMTLFNDAMERQSRKTAVGIAALAERLIAKHGIHFVIISLARAGTPIGILLKRYLKQKYGLNIPHYSISIIRGKGIDKNAMEYIRNKHPEIPVERFQFVDGWTGKGAILTQLKSAVDELKGESQGWEKLSADLAVLADPANICDQVGTYEDFLIPSACLNATVSGLFSRTVLRNDLVDTKAGDFHGSVYFENMQNEDRSIEFIDKVSELFSEVDVDEIAKALNESFERSDKTGSEVVKAVAEKYGIDDVNKIKPGVGETTRVLLRRVPWKVLISDKIKNTQDITHIVQLCTERDVPTEVCDIGNYSVCGIIKNLGADA